MPLNLRFAQLCILVATATNGWAQDSRHANVLPTLPPAPRTSAAASCSVAQSSHLLPQNMGGSGFAEHQGTPGKISPIAPKAATLSGTYVLTTIIPDTCSIPSPARTSFATTDPRATIWYSVTGAAPADTLRYEWIKPDGSVYFSDTGAVTFTGNACFWTWINIAGQSAAQFPGDWQLRVSYNNQPFFTANFTIVGSGAGGGTTRVCRGELSQFFISVGFLGAASVRGQVASGFPMDAALVSALQRDMEAVLTGLAAIPCIAFDTKRITSLSASFSGMSGADASQAVQTLIPEIQQAVQRANASCDQRVSLESLFLASVHLGAASSWASNFICQPIPSAVQANILGEMAAAQAAMAGYAGCTPGLSLAAFGGITFSATRPYDTYGAIIGLIEQVLWNTALSDCCCVCSR